MSAATVSFKAPCARHLVLKCQMRQGCASKGSLVPQPLVISNISRQRTLVRVEAQARRARDDEWVSFDGEEEWEEQSSSRPALSGPIMQQSFRAVGMVVDKLTDVALQMAPEDASPTAVRAAVSGGLILLSLSFVKGILSLFITIGTIVFGAFVAVRVFGLDVSGISDDGTSNKRSNKRKPPVSRGRRSAAAAPEKQDRSVAGLLSSVLGVTSDNDSDDGLVDVWFEGGKGKKRRK